MHFNYSIYFRDYYIAGPTGEWFSNELIQQAGIKIVFDFFCCLHDKGNKDLLSKTQGTMLALLTSMLSYEAGIAWTEDNKLSNKSGLEKYSNFL